MIFSIRKVRLDGVFALVLGLVFAAPVRLSHAQVQPYLGEIRWVAFNFPPKGWANCDGQLLPIAQNAALFSLLGTSFGGNGVATFGLPDLRGRAPIHVSNAYALGTRGGEETHTLTTAEIPAHQHSLNVDPKEGTSVVPTNNYLAKTSAGTSAYGSTSTAGVAMAGAVTAAGSSQAHQNMKPYITLNCIISLTGVFPSRP